MLLAYGSLACQAQSCYIQSIPTVYEMQLRTHLVGIALAVLCASKRALIVAAVRSISNASSDRADFSDDALRAPACYSTTETKLEPIVFLAFSIFLDST